MLKILTGGAYPSATQRKLSRARRDSFESLTMGPTRQRFNFKRNGKLPLISNPTVYDLGLRRRP